MNSKSSKWIPVSWENLPEDESTEARDPAPDLMEVKKKMKTKSIEVPVNVAMAISDDSAQRCLRLLEMYLNDHLNITINHYYQKTDAGIVHMLELVPDGGNGKNAERWIPVTEQLPEKEGHYLVSCDTDYGVEVGRFYIDEDGERYFGCDWNDPDDINAWMPLPTPYKRR